MNSYALEIEHLSVYYDDFCALSDISMKIPAGDFLAVIGPNGGGKTTFLKAILGLVPPSKGKIKVNGRIGYVPQFSKFDRKFPISVEDAVLMGCMANKNSLIKQYNRHDKQSIAKYLELLEISHLKGRQIGQLSGGQLQRVLLARALALNPDILLLDEPTASVDTNQKNHIYKLLEKLNSSMTIIIVTHDTDTVSLLMNNVAFLNKKLHYYGTAKLDKQPQNLIRWD